MNVPGSYRRDIDGLRAVAIAAVVAFHAFPGILPGGFVGVDVFFVISGFLITGIILRGVDDGTFSFAGFYARRIKRIFPALATVLAACLLFGYVALLPDEYEQLGKHAVWGAGFLSNFAFWQETGYFDNAAETKPLLHLWSLGVEEQFYLLWPLVLVMAARLGRPRALLVVCVIGAVSFAANVALVVDHPDAAFYSPITRFWELLVGSVLAFARLRLPPLHANAASLAGIGLIALAALAFDPSLRFPGWLATVPVAGAAFVILAGPDAVLNRLVLATPLAVGLGLVSYPLYLWHWPLLAFERIIGSAPPSLAARGAAVVAALGLAWLTYRWVERPIRHASPMVALRLAAAMAIVAGASGVVWAAGGLEQRSGVASTLASQRQLKRTPETDPQCLAFVGAAPLFPYCRLSDVGGATTVALIGDSHAHALFQGLAEELGARRINVVLLANSGCAPLIGATTGDTETERRLCAARVDQILGVLHDRPEIRDVYIAIRGEAYVVEQPRILHGAGDVGTLFTASLQATVSSLARAGRHLHFVADNPEVSFDPVVCIDRPFRAGQASCSVARADVEAAQRAYRGDIARIDGMTIVEALPALCDASRCPIVADDVLLYADGHHLSVAGGRRLAHAVVAASPPGSAASASPATPTPRR